MKKTTGPGKPAKVSTKVSPKVAAYGKAQAYSRQEASSAAKRKIAAYGKAQQFPRLEKEMAAKAKVKKETVSKPVSGSFGKLPEGVKSLPKTVKLPQQKINSKAKPVKLPKPKIK